MRKHLTFVVSASLLAGGMAVAQQNPVERGVEQAGQKVEKAGDTIERDAERAGQKVEGAANEAVRPDAEQAARPMALPAGIVPKELNEQGDIRNAFEAITESAFTDDAFDSIVNRLVDADRDRIEKFTDSEPNMKPLTDRIAVLQQKWKDKYGKEFDLDEKVVFGQNGFVAIAQGEIAQPKQLVGKWPVQPTVGGMAQPAAAREPGAVPEKLNEADKVAGGDVNLDEGRNVAIARYPASHGLPAIDASLIHELPDIWRFDLPDHMTGQKLHDNLLAQLNALGDGSKWPADVNEGYRVVAHHVLAALYDVQPTNAGQAPRAQ